MRHRVLLGACWAAILVMLLGMPGQARADDAMPAMQKTPAPMVVKEVSLDGSKWSKEVDASFDQLLWYRVEGSLSGNLDEYDSYPYSFVDAYDDTLLPEMETLRVSYVSAKEVQDITDAFELKTGEDGFEVVCSDLKEALPSLGPHDHVVLTYQAHLSNKAHLGFSSPNKNACCLRYKMADGEVASTPEDVALVYSFAIQVQKIDAHTKDALEGVRFALCDENGHWFGSDSWVEEKNREEPATNAQGLLEFGAVGVGQYKLEEVGPLAGYGGIPAITVRLERSVRDGKPAFAASCDEGATIEIDAGQGRVRVLVSNERKESSTGMVRASSEPTAYVRSGAAGAGESSGRGVAVLAVTEDANVTSGTTFVLLGACFIAAGEMKRGYAP